MLRRSFCTTFVIGVSAASALAAQGPNTAAFRSGLVAVVAPTAQSVPIKAIALHWLSYSTEKRYRVLRSTSSAGPWIADHEVLGLVDTIRRLPPNAPVYIRVVALHQVSAYRWEAADTTNSTLTVTPQTITYVGSQSMAMQGYTVGGKCDITPPSTIRMSWNRTPDAVGYRLQPRLMHPGNANVNATFTQLSDILVRDTVLIQQNVPAAEYQYSLQAQYDITNWPAAGQTLTVFGPPLLLFRASISPTPLPCVF
jgi:hypothetical protein